MTSVRFCFFVFFNAHIRLSQFNPGNPRAVRHQTAMLRQRRADRCDGSSALTKKVGHVEIHIPHETKWILFRWLAYSLKQKKHLDKNRDLSVKGTNKKESRRGGEFSVVSAWLVINVSPSYCSFIADCALDHVLMHLAIQVDERLANAAVDNWHTAGIGAGDGCVRRR